MMEAITQTAKEEEKVVVEITPDEVKLDISIVIPCYNEEQVLIGSIQNIERLMSQMRYTFELVFVDDCGQDKTREMLRALAATPHYHVLYHEKNTGVGGTVIDGIRAAKANIIIVVDIDLETGIHYLPLFVQAIEDGYDMAYGHRLFEPHYVPYNLLRRFLSIGYSWLVRNYLGLPFKDTQCGFKAFNKETMMPIFDEIVDKGWVWDTETFTLAKFYHRKVKGIRVIFSRRFDKTSSVKLGRDTMRMWKGIQGIKKRVDEKRSKLKEEFSEADNGA